MLDIGTALTLGICFVHHIAQFVVSGFEAGMAAKEKKLRSSEKNTIMNP